MSEYTKDPVLLKCYDVGIGADQTRLFHIVTNNKGVFLYRPLAEEGVPGSTSPAYSITKVSDGEKKIREKLRRLNGLRALLGDSADD